MADNEWSQEWIDLQNGIHPQDPQDYDFLIQLWRNLRKRGLVSAGSCSNWPNANEVWIGLKITAVSTDGATITLTFDPSAGSTWQAASFLDELQGNKKRWVSWGGGTFEGGTPPSHAPAAYDIVADVDNLTDHTLVLSGQIIDTPTDNTITVQDDGNWTLNRTLASLVGKRAEIIGRGKYTWSDLWPEKPVRVKWIVEPTFVAADYIEQAGANWAVDSLIGCDLIGIFGTRILRVPITSNTLTRINFASQSAAPTGALFVIPGNSYWPSSRASASPSATFQRGRMFQWYRGRRRGTYTHRSDDSLAVESMLAEPAYTSALPATIAIIDRHIVLTGYADNEDTVVNPDMHKCLRGLEAAIETMLGSFIIQWNLVDADHASYMHPGNMAGAMNAIGGNYQERSISSVAGGYATFSGSIAIPDSASAQKAFLVKLTSDGRYVAHGQGTAEASRVEDVLGLTAGTDKIGISFGLPNFFQRRVQRVLPRSIFKPSTVFNGTSYDVIDPPTDANPGEYVHLAPDTVSAIYFEDLYPSSGITTGYLSVTGKAFTTNMKARYVGHNAPDPTTFVQSSDTGSEEYALRAYDDCKCVVNSANGKQWLMPPASGTVVSADAVSATVNVNLWPHTTPRKVHTGTANGASSPSVLIDTTKAADPWWTSMSSTRFQNVAILRSEITPLQWEKRFCTGQTGTSLFPHAAFSSPTVDRAYQIIEPPGSNGTSGPGISSYLRGHTLRFTSAAQGGATYDFEIVGHDNDTFFFAAGDYIPQYGDTWQIIYPRVGQTLRRTGSAWEQADENDVNNAIQPDTVQQYGRLAKHSYWTYPNVNLLLQMKKLIDLMQYTGEQPGWTANGEDNFQLTDLVAHMSSPVTWRGGATSVQDTATTDYNDTPPGPVNAVPYTLYRESIAWDLAAGAGIIQKRYAYLSSFSPLLCPRFGITQRRVQMWGYMTIDAADSDEGYYTFLDLWDVSVRGYREIGTLGGSGAQPQFRKWTKLFDQTTSDATVSVLVGDDTLAIPSPPSVVPTITDLTVAPATNAIEATLVGAYVLDKFAVVDWQPFFDSVD